MLQYFMKTISYTYNSDKLENLIDYTYYKNQKNILIQIFCGEDKKVLEYLSQTLHKKIPQAICIGTTTDGEINNQTISTLKTVISISTFEHTKLKAHLLEDEDSSFCGYKMAEKLLTDNTKLIISFTDGTFTNAEEYLKGISDFDNEVMVCGGMAGDNGTFTQTYISYNDKVISKGAVAVSLNSDILKVDNGFKFDWIPIGLEHTIDKVEGNRIYKISGMTALDFYKKYLGESFVQAEYPLIVQRNGIDIARAVLTKYDDGSFGCGGNLQKGDKVKLGFANAQMIMQNPINYLQKMNKHNIESFYMYSCMARRRYMQNLIKVEIEPFVSLAPTVGFFTYGEFYHNKGHNELLNQTLTLVSLSENQNEKKTFTLTKPEQIGYNESSYIKTIQSLTHLIQESVNDYQEQSRKLEEEKLYSQYLLSSHKEFLRYAVHETNTPLSVIMSNIELFEMENGENKYLSNIEVALKNIFSIYDDLSYLVKKDQIKYPKRKIDLNDYIRSRIEFFSSVARRVNLEFVFKNYDDEIELFFNESKLQRIVDNNLTNAIKYSFENEKIYISLKKEKGLCKFIISSRSKRIHHPKKIFEKYYREEKSLEGFGLGLNLVKRICDEEDVDILVKSDENSTSFIYTFKGYN